MRGVEMSVLRLGHDWNGDVFDSVMSRVHAQPSARDMKSSGDWSPRKKFLCLVSASLASWVIVLAPIYALVQFV